MAGLYSTCTDYLDAIKRKFVLDNAASPYTVWPHADRIGAINEARNIIAEELLCIPTNNTITTTTGTVAYDLSTRNSKLVYVHEVFYASRKLHRSNNFDDVIPGVANGTCTSYYVDAQNKYIHLIPPPPTVKTVYCRTFSVPSEFTTGGDTELLPCNYRDLIVPYALSKGFERDGIVDGVQKSSYYNAEFAEGMKRVKKYRRIM